MNLQNNPSWFGKRYPVFEDLVVAAENFGARVTQADIGDEALYVAPDQALGQPPAIILPIYAPPLLMMWLMAHELAHMFLHGSGYLSQLQRDRQESDAERWAARALIPQARIRHHKNASVDAFMGALSSHYEDLPLVDCEARRLAAHIATIRLKAVEEVA